MKYEKLEKIGKTIAPYAIAVGHTALVAGVVSYSGATRSQIIEAAAMTSVVGGLEGLFVWGLLKEQK